MTQEEAQREANEINSKDPDWFCPLIQGQCRKNCICLKPSEVTTDAILAEQDRYFATNPRCVNIMFAGPLQVTYQD